MTRGSTSSNLNEISRRDLILVAVAVGLIATIYLLASHFTYAIGFPLDDSWIHQTYARNLALHGEWAFRPGIPSAGSTSPFWSGLLAIGFLLHLSPYIWTYFLGAFILFALAILCEWAGRRLVDSYRPRFPWIGIFIVFEWRLVWAGLSGMETLLHGLIITGILVLLMTNSPRFLTLGLLTGLAVWVRPDGLTILGPVFMLILLSKQNAALRFKSVARYLIGFGSLFIPYLLFNLALGGTPMPNTFYAKQAEYASWQSLPIAVRLGKMFLQLLAGPSILLFPGIIGWVVKSIRQLIWESLAAILWCLGFFGLYVFRLPVYQHGRYIMPAMPIFFLFGLLAFAEFYKSKMFGRYHGLVLTAWQVGLGMLVIGFIILGARSYANDVADIESEMVVTAKWVALNIPQEALIAVHDIGAIGYFDDHKLIDLAGLVSPEVIPFIRDEPRLSTYLNQQGVDYLIAFPDFYPTITQNLGILFKANNPVTAAIGQDNLAVYLWKSP